MRRVALLTDFGTADGYVASVKGVLATRAPEAVIDDASHDVAPGDVEGAALALGRYWKLYPPGTVHLVVVDPGVGSERRGLAARVDERYVVAPDNGVISRVLDVADEVELVELADPAHRLAHVSATFHGRDIFAPAAAHLLRGGPIDELGPRLHDPVRLAWPRPVRTEHGFEGVVVHVDRFGNLITNVPGAWAVAVGEGGAGGGGVAAITVEDRAVGRVRRTYADATPGEPLALVGSTGLVEVAVRDGSAAEALGVGRGARVSGRGEAVRSTAARRPGSEPGEGR